MEAMSLILLPFYCNKSLDNVQYWGSDSSDIPAGVEPVKMQQRPQWQEKRKKKSCQAEQMGSKDGQVTEEVV